MLLNNVIEYLGTISYIISLVQPPTMPFLVNSESRVMISFQSDIRLSLSKMYSANMRKLYYKLCWRTFRHLSGHA